MAIPLWRQYTRLSRDERDAILRRRRRRLNDSNSKREVLAAFLQDARDVRSAYRRRGGARPEAEETRAPRVDRASRFAQRQEMLNSVSDPTDRQIADTVTSRNQSIDVASVPGRITELRAQRTRELAEAFRDGRITVTEYNNSRQPQVVNNWVQNELIDG